MSSARCGLKALQTKVLLRRYAIYMHLSPALKPNCRPRCTPCKFQLQYIELSMSPTQGQFAASELRIPSMSAADHPPNTAGFPSSHLLPCPVAGCLRICQNASGYRQHMHSAHPNHDPQTLRYASQEQIASSDLIASDGEDGSSAFRTPLHRQRASAAHSLRPMPPPYAPPFESAKASYADLHPASPWQNLWGFSLTGAMLLNPKASRQMTISLMPVMICLS